MKFSSSILGQVRKQCASYFKKKGIDCPEISADSLVAHVLGVGKLELIMRPRYMLNKQELQKLTEFVLRRGQGEPIAYILGQKEFFGLDFQVSSNVLIPRPETEEIIELVESLFDLRAQFFFADIGTGSGAIAVSLLKKFPCCKGMLIDTSLPALRLAACNAYKYIDTDRYQVLQSDLCSSLKSNVFDLIVSNPPYLKEADFDLLSREVSAYEPRKALIAGQNRDGVQAVIAKDAFRCLKPHGWLIMEMDCRQKLLKYDLFDTLPHLWKDTFIHQDLAGHDRIIGARKILQKTHTKSPVSHKC